ncbi:Hypothetical protein PHPALM_14383 [Phytophthora palmivora]|uniref:Uncharacterized protein n=1 Tax=Phytophthora palmivora TaxID=4796 RepID=A0A2P4XUT5_9STRA|nr:Hypothetical protein PHPALM_14383 [Phytophthora palmivora]
MHAIHDRCCELANNDLDGKISHIESASDSHQLFTTARDLSPKKSQQLLLRDETDVVWAHKWLTARVQKYREIIHILGIDLSLAFDNNDREKVLEVLRIFLHYDELRLIRLRLSATTLSLRVGNQVLRSFNSNATGLTP